MANCVSYERSLELLKLGPTTCGAYGYDHGTVCGAVWARYQREGWCNAIAQAEDEIMRDIGAPLCPMEIYDEAHRLQGCNIYTNQKPIAYIGMKTYTDWVEIPLVDNTDEKYVDICETDIGTNDVDAIEFAYPDGIEACYDGCVELQEPCRTTLTGTCGAGEDGYRFTWPLCQLADPTLDIADPTDPTHFITAVKYRFYTIDTSLAVEAIGTCSDATVPTLTATIADATEGIVCVEQNAGCGVQWVRLNYATAFDAYGMPPALEQAIVNLAVIKTGGSPVKPCGCDNTYIEWLLDIDPTAQTEFATKLSYGPTNAGMQVMRTVNKYINRPNFNQPVTSGGFFGRSKTIARIGK